MSSVAVRLMRQEIMSTTEVSEKQYRSTFLGLMLPAAGSSVKEIDDKDDK